MFRLRALIGSEVTFRHAAWLCAAAGLALSLLGIYAIDLATAGTYRERFVTLGGYPKQGIVLVAGVLGAGMVALPQYRLFRFAAYPVFVVSVLLLVFLLVPWVPTWLVRPHNGARSWINLRVIDFQPSEMAKVAFILAQAEYLRHRRNHRTIPGLLAPALFALVPMGLIVVQPDLGTACLFAPTLGAMLVTAGAKLRHLTTVVLIALMLGPAAYPLLKPHQKKRIQGIVRVVSGNRDQDLGEDYQHFTAMRVAGAGGLTGMHEEKARAIIRYNALPEPQNDMIFAVIVCRFGLVGGVLVLALYGAWFLGAVTTAARCREPFGRLVVVGCMGIVGSQIFINIGMTVGMLPIIGITLPFLSAGGTSLLTVWVMTGLIMNVAMRPNVRLARPTFEFSDDEEW